MCHRLGIPKVNTHSFGIHKNAYKCHHSHTGNSKKVQSWIVFFSCQDTKPQYRRLQQSGHYAWQRRHQGDCTSSTFWILEVPVSFDGGLCRSGEAPLLHTMREWRPLPCHHTGIGSLWLYALSAGSWTDGRAYLPMFVSPTSQCLWDKLSVWEMPFVTLMRTNTINTAKHLPWDERPMMAKAWQ